MPRAFLVQTLTVQAETAAEAAGGKPATENGDVSMTIAGSVFVLQSAPAATAPANPAGTATTPADPAAAPPADAVAN